MTTRTPTWTPGASVAPTLAPITTLDRSATPGGRCSQPVLADLLNRLGAAAELPDELRHPHALPHTCTTELLRAGATSADVHVFLGHASVKTTSI